MNVHAIRTRLFKERESLDEFIEEHVPVLKNESVLVVTSKIAALAEDRVAPLSSEKDKERIIRAESDIAIKTAPFSQWSAEQTSCAYMTCGKSPERSRSRMRPCATDRRAS